MVGDSAVVVATGGRAGSRGAAFARLVAAMAHAGVLSVEETGKSVTGGGGGEAMVVEQMTFETPKCWKNNIQKAIIGLGGGGWKRKAIDEVGDIPCSSCRD